MTRIDRYQAALVLADLIAEGNPRHQEFRIEQAVQDIRDHLAAKTRDREVTDTLEALFTGFSVKTPSLRLVKGDDQ